MQTLQAFPLDLNKSRRLEISRIFYDSEQLPSFRQRPSVKFVPFQNQRDGIGKLISKSNSQNLQKQFSNTQSKPLKRVVEYESVQEQKMEQNLSSYFKKNDIESRQLLRSRVIPKAGILVLQTQRKNARPTNDYYDIDIGLDKIKLKRKDFSIKKEVKRQSSQKFIQKEENPQIKPNKQKKIQLRVSKSQKKVNEDRELIEKIPKSKLSFQHPELKRYRQLKKLSIKVFNDYEVGHEKFKQKMEQSKLIAQRIKKQLQFQ